MSVAHITSPESGKRASYDYLSHRLAIWRQRGPVLRPRQPPHLGWRGHPRFDGPTWTRLGTVEGNPSCPHPGWAGFIPHLASEDALVDLDWAIRDLKRVEELLNLIPPR